MLLPIPDVLETSRALAEQPEPSRRPSPASVSRDLADLPRRSAWVEIDLLQFSRNYEIITRQAPKGVQVMAVVKDEAYGHGALEAIRAASTHGIRFLALGTVEEAIRLANDTEYGLSAAVFGRDVNRAFEIAKRIDSGMCHINGPTVHDEGQMPFGGVKASGYGRFGGKAAVEQFTELRWITIQTTPRHYPF